MDILIAILVCIVVVIVSVLFFGGWVIVAIFRVLTGTLRGDEGRARRTQPERLPPLPQRLTCAHGNCRAANPAAARFCGRCGRPVAGRPAPVVRRVAIW